MISQSPELSATQSKTIMALVRYGRVPQVARFAVPEQQREEIAERPSRNTSVVVQTDRGLEVGQLLKLIHAGINDVDQPTTGDLLRTATPADQLDADRQQQRAIDEFDAWQQRVADWKLDLQLIDLEWTLDGEKLVLYVLNGQNAETTRLALLAAAAGLGIVHVQPVAAEGIVSAEPQGGCGSGGCGSGGCG